MLSKKSTIYTVVAALLLAVVAFMFFFPDAMEGRVLQQHDIQQGLANGHEGQEFEAATGESTRWTNSLFGGMPTFQIAPSYPANEFLTWIQKVFMLGLPSPANLLFGLMLGFFIMCLCMKMKWSEALFASLAWGFSSYFIIIIGAGHIWKFLTLCYIPPTIGGVVLIYRRKWLAGAALTALFSAMQLMSNHPQMSYYFMFVMFFLALAWLWIAIKEKSVGKWAISTCVALAAGLTGVAANSSSLYNSLEYSKETVRGRATDITEPGAPAATGMDKDAITAWSYGIDETWTLLVPNVKGGASLKPVAGQNQMKSVAETDLGDSYLSPEEMSFVSQFTQYFGDQPMTNGPVYVGAFVLLLAILGMFVVEGKWETPVKWALFASAILSILLSWGHNFPALTYFMIDHFPGYNKFRTVSSILVILEFCIPLLAALCVRQIIRTEGFFSKNKWTVICVMGGGLLVCFLGWIAPGMFGEPYSAQELDYLREAGVFGNPAYGNVMKAIEAGRKGLVASDSLRSLMFILAGCALLYLWGKKAITNPTVWVCCLAALATLDLFSIDKRYVNSDNFLTAESDEEAFVPTETDKAILKDTTNYRVMDIPGFASARSSYFHKTIGGYHAAKLTRYNDLITHQISQGENPYVLNMLNAKYFITGNGYEVNGDAFGNAWLIDTLQYVLTPREEMDALSQLTSRNKAVADKAFASVIGNPAAIAPGDTIYETSYAPNRLTYKAHLAHGGVAVFSEVYFPWGWKATVNGKETPIGRVNYLLRAMRLPAGDSDIVMTFEPESVKTADNVSMAAVVIIYVLCIAALGATGYRIFRNRKEEKKETKETK